MLAGVKIEIETDVWNVHKKHFLKNTVSDLISGGWLASGRHARVLAEAVSEHVRCTVPS